MSQRLKILKDAGLVDDVAAGTRRIYRLNPVALAALRDQLGTSWQRALAGYAHAAEAPGKKGWMTQTDTATVRKQVVVDAPCDRRAPRPEPATSGAGRSGAALITKSARFGSVSGLFAFVPTAQMAGPAPPTLRHA